jgi:hypothetical protein
MSKDFLTDSSFLLAQGYNGKPHLIEDTCGLKQGVHVWKSRNLTYTGKTLIVKNLLISLCGYEIEMRGIPEKYVKEITTLVAFFVVIKPRKLVHLKSLFYKRGRE